MTIDVTGFGTLTDEEMVRLTYHDNSASPREMSLAIRLGDALDMIRTLKMYDERTENDLYH